MSNIEPRDAQVSKLFVVIGCLFVTCLLVSNIIAGKLITVFGLVLPAAVLLFPLNYIFGDVLTEVYGFAKTRLIIWTGFVCNILMALVFMATIALPFPSFWEGQGAYAVVLGMTPRIVFASLVAYFIGEWSNSAVLSRMKLITKGRWLWTRTIGSTVVGQGLDTVIFITITFWGTVTGQVLVQMIIAQYLWKVIYEVIITPFTYIVVNWIKRKEGVDTFDHGVSYNPFRLDV